MSNAAAPKGRQLIQGIDASGAFPVEYRFAHAKSGNRRLVVVFANFAAPQDYGWSNGVLDQVRANILWIRDRFDGMNSYYLCKDMDFSLERSVAGLIFKVMRALEITADDVTVWGGSKGGSAALFFGLRYGFRNIVSLVPQFAVGTYVRTVHPQVARFMLGEGVPPENVRAVDAILPDLVRSGTHRSANVYLLSSPQDQQYTSQVEPYLGLFAGYDNFNFIYSESPFITDHTQVTRRNVPALLGLLNLLADGIAPRLGHVRNGYEEPDRDRSGIDAMLAADAVVKDASVFPPPVVTGPAPGGQVPVTGSVFTGLAPGAARVSLWENGRFLANVPVGADGSWVWEPAQWSPGRHLVRLYAADGAGFQSPRTQIEFTAAAGAAAPSPPVFPSGPALPAAPVVGTPASYQEVPAAGTPFSGFAAGAARVRFREGGIDLGACPVAPDGGWAWHPDRPWLPGPHLVEVVAADHHGVEGPPTGVAFTAVDTSASLGYHVPPGR
ncbi:hypothetical protein [Streptomyces sp. NPDC005012]|uniref:hypothetical protein n=1 Tax=Streptomyces sp. NPDC005012 TaxID=3154558 RepID=UPI0033BDB67F